MAREGVHVRHDDGLSGGGDMAADTLAEGNAQAAERALIGADDKLIGFQGIDEVETSPEETRLERLGEQAGSRGIAGGIGGFPGHDAVDFFLDLAVGFSLVHGAYLLMG